MMSNKAQAFPVNVENISPPGKLKNPVPTVKNHTVLDDGIDLEDESKTLVGNRKHILADFHK